MTASEVSGAGAIPRRRSAPTGRRQRQWLWPLLMLAPASVLLAFFFFTVATMLRYSFAPHLGPVMIGEGVTLANYERFLGSTFYVGYLTRSLWIATYCTAITAVLGYLIAYFMYRSGPLVKLVVGTILIVQFFTAYVIRTYAVMLVIGRTGILNQTLMGLGIVDEPVRLLFTETGVAIGMVLAARLSSTLLGAPAADAGRLARVLAALGLPVALPAIDPARLLGHMRLDKKNVGGRLRLILWRGVGQAEIASDVDEAAVRDHLAREAAGTAASGGPQSRESGRGEAAHPHAGRASGA